VEGFMDREVLGKEVGTEGLENYWVPADMDWLQCGAIWYFVIGHRTSDLDRKNSMFWFLKHYTEAVGNYVRIIMDR
jgi:hypothetical protein